MQSQAQHSSWFHIILPAAITALLITSVALPMTAQNAVPPTAVQAAKSPQFASKLAHPAARPASPPKPTLARQRSHSGPGANRIYDNGPINGNVDAWTINFGFIVSDTFTVVSGETPVTGMSFGAWLFPGDTLISAELSITSSPNGGTSYFDQTVNFAGNSCTLNQYSFDVCTVTTSFNGPMLNPGTYWVNLQNAIVPSGNPVYWDENSGEGCESSGCPSQAEENEEVGTIPSESFTILGQRTCFNPEEEKPTPAAKVVTVPPSPTQTYRVIYNFTGGADGASPFAGLVIDAAGNLYGTTGGGGGPAEAGTVFKLTPGASGWRFSRLYTFTGPNGSLPETTPVLGADGTVIGTALLGGMGSGLGNGVLFGLSPAGHILPSVFSNWMESLLYDFTGGSDGANPAGNIVLDSSGNIYGNAGSGGANRGGTLYEFTNSGVQALHAFPAFQGDGYAPLGVVNGLDGLYGLTNHGGNYGTGTLYTTAGSYQVLHSFGPYEISGNPTSLTADAAGNLYATESFRNCFASGANVSQFSPPDWNGLLLVTLSLESEISSWVSTDASGNVYGTTDYGGQFGQGSVFKLTCCWNYTDLHDFTGAPNDGTAPGASPVVDAQGNIYGTTSYGGAYGQGIVWEISP